MDMTEINQYGNKPRRILHIDADAFFASVEQAADLKLRGKPVAVGGLTRGVIASASYEARRMGVRAAMPTVMAKRICPKLIVVAPDFEKYERFSRWMFSYGYDLTPDVEITSIDEGYLDLSSVNLDVIGLAKALAGRIRDALRVSVSEGIGSNKLISQIASKFKKPAGFVHVPHGQETAFLHPLDCHWLPLVGPKTEELLRMAGITKIWQIASIPISELSIILGEALAFQLKQFANAQDNRPVVPFSFPAKSISRQYTFAEDTTNEEYVIAILKRLADELIAQLRSEDRAARSFSVTARYNDMEEDRASESVLEPICLESDIYPLLERLCKKAWRRKVSLRMIGVRCTDFYKSFLFGGLPIDELVSRKLAEHRLAKAVDKVRGLFGAGAVMRGHDMLLERLSIGRKCTARSDFRIRSVTLKGRLTGGTVSRIFPAKPDYIPRPDLKCTVMPSVRSYYSFLDSTLSIQAIVDLAVANGFEAVGLVDKGNLHGVYEFWVSAKNAGLKPLIGAEVNVCGRPLKLYVMNKTGYANLCRLLSGDLFVKKHETSLVSGKKNSGLAQDKDFFSCSKFYVDYEVSWNVLAEFSDGLIAVGADVEMAKIFGDRFYLAVRDGVHAMVNRNMRVLPVAMWDVHYIGDKDRLTFEVLKSIKSGSFLDSDCSYKGGGDGLRFRTANEITLMFRTVPETILNLRKLADLCNFEFEDRVLDFPEFCLPAGINASEFLRRLVMDGLRRRYGNRSNEMLNRVNAELEVINRVGYAEYFLTVWDLLQECKRLGIDWLTRGSAADSLVCYCLGISNICPIRFGLYFERFLNSDRMQMNKLPDIDIDFPHDRRDEVVDMIFRRYGFEHAARVGGFSTYQSRSAFIDVVKVFGVSAFQAHRISEKLPHVQASAIAEALQFRKECSDLPLDNEPYKTALRIAMTLDNFPRHPKMHPCGVVVSRASIWRYCPCFASDQGYPVTHFDMESLENLGLVKLDILAQGGLAVIRDVRASLQSRGIRVEVDSLDPWQDQKVWNMISSGQAIAVHHIESPAMLSLARRCGVHDIHGLIAMVSVIRPGAANENHKTEFVQRYRGLSPVTFPCSLIEKFLRDSFGLLLYEEQVLQICNEFAGLTLGDSDALRRALGKKNALLIEKLKDKFYKSALALGRSKDLIELVWSMIDAFQGYAFCKAHSAAYAIEAYTAAWLKLNYPAEFMAAVLSSGKGFYAPIVYVMECYRLGLDFLQPSVNRPGPGFTVEPGGNSRQKIRVPLFNAKGLSESIKQKILEEKHRGPFYSISEFCSRVKPSLQECVTLIKAGAFDEFTKSKTAQFWEVQHLLSRAGNYDSGQCLFFQGNDINPGLEVGLLEPDKQTQLQWELEVFGYPVRSHPLELFPDIAWDSYCRIADLEGHIGEKVVVCGLVVEQRIHHQQNGDPMKFITVADWSGTLEAYLFANVYKSYGLQTIKWPVLELEGIVEPFEGGTGYALRVLRVGKARSVRVKKNF
jgi:DNA-directed DNA polymerase III PolC